MRKSKIRKFACLINKNHQQLLTESQSNQESHKKSNDNQRPNQIIQSLTMVQNPTPKNEVFRTINRK